MDASFAFASYTFNSKAVWSCLVSLNIMHTVRGIGDDIPPIFNTERQTCNSRGDWLTYISWATLKLLYTKGLEAIISILTLFLKDVYWKET